jgi:DNA mismatch repair ATPase MutS
MDWKTASCETVWFSFIWLTPREVEARLAAVEEIKDSTNYKLEDIAGLLTRLPDLEKGLVRIHYGRVRS